MKQIITGCMALILFAACNNNSYSNSTTTDTVTTNTTPATTAPTDTQMNRMNDSVSRDHTTNADTGLHPTH